VNAISKRVVVLLLAAPPSLALAGLPNAEEGSGEFGSLPKPLDEISGNMADFEKSGHFTIADARFSEIGYRKQDAFIWTLRARKPITYRHVILLLRKLRDVRFYAKGERRPQEKLSTLLFYSDRVPLNAANGEVLSRDQELDVWIYVNRVQVRKLNDGGANTVVFRELRR
jgi:hypothetical protein